jgi:hypothetical protein
MWTLPIWPHRDSFFCDRFLIRKKPHKDSRKSSDELSYQVWFQLAQAQASGFKEDQNVKAYG